MRDEFASLDPPPNRPTGDIEPVRYLTDRVEIEFIVVEAAFTGVGGNNRLRIAGLASRVMLVFQEEDAFPLLLALSFARGRLPV